MQGRINKQKVTGGIFNKRVILKKDKKRRSSRKWKNIKEAINNRAFVFVDIKIYRGERKKRLRGKRGRAVVQVGIKLEKLVQSHRRHPFKEVKQQKEFQQQPLQRGPWTRSRILEW